MGVLRDYAQFLIEVANRPARAQSLLEEADAIEDEQSRWQQERARDIVLLGSAELDTSSDQTGVCTIGSEGETQGIVKTVNAYWPQLLGYPRREMVGQNISTIMPEPISTVHNALLSHAIDHGGDNFMSLSRIVMAKHANGFVFPAMLMVRLLEDAFGGMLQRIETSTHFLLFVERGFKVTGMCENSSTRFGVSPKLCLREDVPVDRFVPHIRDIMDSDLRALPGGSLSPPHRMLIRAPQQQPDGGQGEMREATAVAKFQRLTLKVSAETLYIMQWHLPPEEEERLVKPSPAADLRPAIKGNAAPSSGSESSLAPAGRSRLRSAMVPSFAKPLGEDNSGAKGSGSRSGNPTPAGAVDPFAAGSPGSGEEKEGEGGQVAILGDSEDGADEERVALDTSYSEERAEGEGGREPSPPKLIAPRPSMQQQAQRLPVHIQPAVVAGGGAGMEGPAAADGGGASTPMEGTRSEAGSSHGSSTTSSSAVLPMLRKSVDLHEHTLEPSLRVLRVNFLWTVLLAGAAAVVTLVVNELMVASVMNDLDALQDNGRRQMLATRITADALSLGLAHRGLLPNSTEHVTALRDSLRSASDEFFRLHQGLYDHAVDAGLDQVVAQYTDPSLTFVDQDGSEKISRQLTLLEAGLEFVKRARLVADSPGVAELAHPDIAFLLANGVDSLPDACNASAFKSVSAATVAKTDVVDLYLWQFVLALVVVEASLVVFVHLAVQQTQHTKESVFQLFLNVPRDALTGLRDRAQRLLSTAMDEEDMAAGEEGSDEDEDEERRKPQEEPAKGSDDVPIGADQAAANRSRRRKRAPPRQMYRSRWEQFAATVRFGGGMFVVLFFFVAIFLQVNLDSSTTLKVPRNVYFSTQRYATSNELYLRTMLYLSSDDSDRGAMFNSSMEAADKVRREREEGMHCTRSPCPCSRWASRVRLTRAWHPAGQVLHFSHILLFGDAEAGTFSELSFSEQIKHQQLDDGCAGDPAPEQCAAFKVRASPRPLLPVRTAMRAHAREWG